jgi:thiol-disulfide isomerase/thioredoxin
MLRLGLSDDDTGIPQETATQPGHGDPDRADRLPLVPSAGLRGRTGPTGARRAHLAGQTLADLRGKVVLVNFWATWCPYCRHEMPAMEAFYRENRARGFEIVAYSLDKTQAEADDYLREAGYSFPGAAHVSRFRRLSAGSIGTPVLRHRPRRGDPPQDRRPGSCRPAGGFDHTDAGDTAERWVPLSRRSISRR